MVWLESEGARDVNPQGFCPRLPLSPSLRMGRPRRPRLDLTREIFDGSLPRSWS